jgi:hypothetical protein
MFQQITAKANFIESAPEFFASFSPRRKDFLFLINIYPTFGSDTGSML